MRNQKKAFSDFEISQLAKHICGTHLEVLAWFWKWNVVFDKIKATIHWICGVSKQLGPTG